MKTTNFIALLLMVSLPGFAQAKGASSPSSPFKAARTEKECMDQWRSRITDPRPRAGTNEGLPPEEMCQNNNQLPVDEGRCQKIYEAVLKAYSDAEKSVQNVCALVPKAYAAKCDTQGNCLKGTAEFQQEYSEKLKIHAGHVNQLIEEMDKMAKLGLETSEQYANDLKEFKASPDQNQGSEKARRHGGGTIAEALRNHADQDAESVLSLLQKARSSSTISGQELEGMKSPYVYEQLQASATAFDQKRELQEYAGSIKSQQLEASSHATKIGEQSTNLNSVPQASLSSGLNIPSANAPAVTGSTGADAASGFPVPQFDGGSAYAEGSAEKPAANQKTGTYIGSGSLASKGNKLNLSISQENPSVVAAQVPTGAASGSAEGAVNVSGTSIPLKGSLRADLRARLSRQHAGIGVGSSEGESSSAEKRLIEQAAMKKEAAEKEVFSGSGEQFENGRMPALMLTSETEGAVKDLVNDFERSMAGNRSIASVDDQNGSEILTSESPSLFRRLKEVHERCIKRGCVTKVAEGNI